MPFVFTLFCIILLSLSFCLIVFGFLLRAVFIPIPDIDLLSRRELLESQKEYAINYPLGTGLFYIGLFLMILVIILIFIKIMKSKRVTS